MPAADPPLDDAWRAIAAEVPGLDPGETVTRQHLEATVPAGKMARLQAPAPPPITLPDLPYLPFELPHPPRAGRADAEYEVTGVLGEGGAGRVLLARQRSLQREVALKVLKTRAAGGALADTLLAEAIITGSIEHPSVVPVHALGRDADGQPVLVMKRIEGASWRDLARDPAHPAWASIAPDHGDRLDAHLDILMAVCNAAHFAHSRGVVHRDLKLSNVMVGAFGEVYLVDWGIALRMRGDRGAGEGVELVGTPAYMAPEMVAGVRSQMDARTDVYLLGATLHALIAGKARHRGDSLVAVLVSARESAPFEYGTDVPAELAALCNRAMHRDPAQRFQSALELRQALASFRRHRGSIALADQAAARLDELDALLARRAAGTPAPGDDRRAHRCMTECRFGFMQALDAWRGNQAARTGLDRCLERMVDHEIAQRDDEGARALLAELSEPRPDLARRVEALSAEIEAARARDARLLSMERDVDLTAGARAQLPLIALLPIFAVTLIVAFVRADARPPTGRALVAVPAVFFVLLFAALVALRPRLPSAISRRAFALLLLLPASTLLHRILGVLAGAPAGLILATDLIFGGTVAAAIGIAAVPRARWAAVPCVLGAAAMALWPGSAVPLFEVAAVVAVTLLFVAWLRALRPGAGP